MEHVFFKADVSHYTIISLSARMGDIRDFIRKKKLPGTTSP